MYSFEDYYYITAIMKEYIACCSAFALTNSVMAILVFFTTFLLVHDVFPLKTLPDGWSEVSIIRVYENDTLWWVRFDDQTSLGVVNQTRSVDIDPVYKNGTYYTYEDMYSAPDKRYDRAFPVLAVTLIYIYVVMGYVCDCGLGCLPSLQTSLKPWRALVRFVNKARNTLSISNIVGRKPNPKEQVEEVRCTAV